MAASSGAWPWTLPGTVQPPLRCGFAELFAGRLAQCTTLDLAGAVGRTNESTANATLTLLEGSLGSNATGARRLRSLILSDNAELGDIALLRLSEALRTHASLRHLALDSSNMSTFGAQVLADVLVGGAELSSLSLSFNTIGATGAVALAAALPASGLGVLRLSRVEAGASGAVAIASAIGRANSTLRRLSLDQNAIGDEGATALGGALVANAALASVDLSYNRIGAAGAEALAAGVGANRVLRELRLSSNGVGDAGAIALAAMLRNNSALRTLALWDSGVSCDGADAIERALRVNRVLSELFLHATDAEASEQTMARIQRAVERNAELTRPTGAEEGSVLRDEL